MDFQTRHPTCSHVSTSNVSMAIFPGTDPITWRNVLLFRLKFSAALACMLAHGEPCFCVSGSFASRGLTVFSHITCIKLLVFAYTSAWAGRYLCILELAKVFELHVQERKNAAQSLGSINWPLFFLVNTERAGVAAGGGGEALLARNMHHQRKKNKPNFYYENLAINIMRCSPQQLFDTLFRWIHLICISNVVANAPRASVQLIE